MATLRRGIQALGSQRIERKIDPQIVSQLQTLHRLYFGHGHGNKSSLSTFYLRQTPSQNDWRMMVMVTDLPPSGRG